MDVNPTWIPTWHAMDNVRGLPDWHEAHVKEVGLPQNWETITLETLTTIDLLYLLCKRAHMSRIIII